MTRNLGTFASMNHRVANKHSAIDSIAVEIAAMQKQFLFNSAGHFARLPQRQPAWSPSVDLALKLDMIVVLAVFTFVGAILLGAF